MRPERDVISRIRFDEENYNKGKPKGKRGKIQVNFLRPFCRRSAGAWVIDQTRDLARVSGNCVNKQASCVGIVTNSTSGSAEEVLIGYEDRFLGIVEIPFMDWGEGDYVDVPMHRIRYFRCASHQLVSYLVLRLAPAAAWPLLVVVLQ